jgi:hypothetical protein
MLDNDEWYILPDKRLIYTCELFHFETYFTIKLPIADRLYKIADKRFGMVIAWLVILGRVIKITLVILGHVIKITLVILGHVIKITLVILGHVIKITLVILGHVIKITLVILGQVFPTNGN